ncbi:unnamed protein product [Alternaria alternata]
MPPKKSVANSDAGDAGGPFKWEGPNDAKLLLLTQGRWVKPDEYPQLSSAFPGEPSPNRVLPLNHFLSNLFSDSPAHPFCMPFRQAPILKLSQAISSFPGTSTGSIRNRISALRVKQRDLYLELSWELPEGGAGHSAKKASKNSTPKIGTPKRKVDGGFDDGSGEGGEEVKTPSKKPRGRNPKAEVKEKSVDKESVEEDAEQDVEVEKDYIPMAKRVKEEPVEEMV